MDIVISGNGIGSKILTILLSKSSSNLHLFKSITIFDNNKQINNDHNKTRIKSKPIQYQGLWGPSIHILNHLGLYDKLIKADNLISVIKTSYRSVDGRLLAKPHTDLNQPLQGILYLFYGFSKC